MGVAAVLASVGGPIALAAAPASAFSPGTGCGTGTGSSSGLFAEAHFTALPPCAGYIRVASICANFAGQNQTQGYGLSRTWGEPNSTRTCTSPYNAALRSWGWQVSGTR